MTNFCLWSIFVRSALFSHRLESPCEAHTGAAPRFSPNPHPTTHNPPSGAHVVFMRPIRCPSTCNPMVITYLCLCPKKNQTCSRHASISYSGRLPQNSHPTTHPLT